MSLIWDKCKANHKAFEMVGLLLALGAWSWDLHVQTLFRYKDGYERQLMHMIDSYHNYANRDLLAIEALTVQVTLEKPSLTRGEIFETLWESSPAFKESWWELMRTHGLWLHRIHSYMVAYVNEIGIEMPRAFVRAEDKLRTLRARLFEVSDQKDEALATSALIRRHDVSTITNLVDDCENA